MRSILATLVVVLAMPAAAQAAWMGHYDLTGLVVQSEAIVVAERGAATTAQYARTTSYRVTRSVRGPITVGTTLPLEDFLYDYDSLPTEPTVVLFLARDTEPPRAWRIVGSGLRVVSHGEVMRFEQWDNPGGWHAVPQGTDPLDVRHEIHVEHGLSLDAFFRALDVALARDAALTREAAERDPLRRRAALLTLLAAPLPDDLPDDRMMGFYVDKVAHHIEWGLVDRGDVEGAVLALLRDRSAAIDSGLPNAVPAADLATLAADATKPLDVRRGALLALARGGQINDDPQTLDRAIALLADPSPLVRMDAAQAVASAIGWMSSGADGVRFRRAGARATAALQAALTREQSPTVLYALVDALTSKEQRLPPRRGLSAVAHARVHGTRLDASVTILSRAAHVATVTIVVHGAAAVTLPLDLRWEIAGGGSGGGSGIGSAPPPSMPGPGRYPLDAVVQLAGGTTSTVSAGTLVVDASGARIEPAL